MAQSYDFLQDCKLNTLQYLQYHAAQNSQRLAIVTPQSKLTYGALVSLVEGIAKRLNGLGVSSGTRVELSLENDAVALVLSLALQRLGCVCFIPFSKSLTGLVPCEYYLDVRLVEGHQAKPLIVTEDWFTLSAQSEAGSALPGGFKSIHSLAVITSSTGTTGQPKIIGSTLEKLHHSIVAGLHHPGQAAGKAPCLVAVKFGSLWGYRQMLTVLWSGGTLVLAAGHSSDTAKILKLLRVRHLATTVGRLADWVGTARKNPRLMDGLEAVTTAGAMLTPAMEREVQTYICRQVYTNYGTTETGLIASGNSAERSKFPNCVGSIVPDLKLEIVDELGRVLPEGQSGKVRIWVGELRDTLGGTALKDGWFYPGDMGAIHDGNMLCIEGRADDMVNLGGRKYNLDALDGQLVGCKGILDHALFSVDDSLGVARLYCAVCPGDGFDPKIVEASLKDTPRLVKIFQLEKLPRSADGKIRRRDLVALVTGPRI